MYFLPHSPHRLTRPIASLAPLAHSPYCPTALLPYRPTALPPYRPTALPPYRLQVLVQVEGEKAALGAEKAREADLDIELQEEQRRLLYILILYILILPVYTHSRGEGGETAWSSAGVYRERESRGREPLPAKATQ